jgi:hypothetical protein
MRTKILLLCALLFSSQAQVFACAVCTGDPNSSTSKSMAMAIWFLMAAVMSVLGGVTLFGLHLWRCEKMPLEPHQELTQEDLKEYD